MMLSIYFKEVYDEVHARSWWRGESAKQQDDTATILQESEDGEDELYSFAKTAFSQVVLWGKEKLAQSGLRYDFRNGSLCADIEFESMKEDMEGILRTMVMDYVSQYVVYKWALMVRPEIAVEYAAALPEYENRLKNALQMSADGWCNRRQYRLMGL